MEQIIICQIFLRLLYALFYLFHVTVKITWGNLNKNLNNRILKYILDRLKPAKSKNSSSLNLLRSSPCFPTMLMIFLFAPFKRFSYFCTSDIPSFKLFVFFTSSFRFAFSSSDNSRIDSCNSFLIISGVFFLFVFLAPTRNYK